MLRLARRGRRHPKAEVAEAARRWAQALLQPHPGRRTTRGAWWVLLPLALVSETAAGGWLGMSLAERRAAKVIMLMEDHRGDERPPRFWWIRWKS